MAKTGSIWTRTAIEKPTDREQMVTVKLFDNTYQIGRAGSFRYTFGSEYAVEFWKRYQVGDWEYISEQLMRSTGYSVKTEKVAKTTAEKLWNCKTVTLPLPAEQPMPITITRCKDYESEQARLDTYVLALMPVLGAETINRLTAAELVNIAACYAGAVDDMLQRRGGK